MIPARTLGFFAACLLLGAPYARAEALLVPVNRKTTAPEVTPLPGPKPSPEPPTWRPPTPSDLPFRVTSSRVDVRIEENVATTTLEQAFHNLTGRDLEVRVMIPLPKGATINKSALSMNDEMIEGKLYDAQEAQSIYESIVSQRRDPALLRFAGENLYEARIFPIPPNQERRLKFSYDMVLAPVQGMYDFRHILAGSQLYRSGVEKFQFECIIRSKDALGPVYSPSHKINVARPDAKSAVVKLSEDNLSTDADLRIYYAPSTQDVSLRVVAHRESGSEEGYFMVLGRPDDQLNQSRILPKEIVFVLDTSGSMAGEKIDQARKALLFCIGQLNEQDRFNLVTFSTTVKALSAGTLLDANKENVSKALKAVEGIEATGGTAIDEALRTALAHDFTGGPGKAKLVIFLTDGLPSVGVTDAATILKDVGEANKAKARIFNFGVGTDVNTHLLDRVAMDHDGSSSYVAPREDLELKLSDFYARIKNPVMTGVEFAFAGETRTHSIYPKRIPAIFKGDEILLFGRFKGAGPGSVTLSGDVAGERRTIKVDVAWPEREKDNAFLPRVWAMRKIGHLLEEVRLHGNNPELIDEVVKLSQRHGIVTPYTSQLVLEPGMDPRQFNRRGRRDRDGVADMPLGGLGGASSSGGGGAFAAEGGMDAAKAPEAAAQRMDEARKKAKAEAKQVAAQAQGQQSGEVAVALAETEKLLKDASGLADAKPTAPGKSVDRNEKARQELRANAYKAGFAGRLSGKEAEEVAEGLAAAQQASIKHIGERTFYLRAGMWVDSAFKGGEEKPEQVEAFGPAYFELIKKHPDLGRVLALGGRILVVVEGKAYQIEPATGD